jgi:hypothetical protein
MPGTWLVYQCSVAVVAGINVMLIEVIILAANIIIILAHEEASPNPLF